MRHLIDLLPLRFRDPRLGMAGKRMFFYVVIGLIAGLGSIAFQYLCQLGIYGFMELMAGYRPPSPAGEAHLFQPSGIPFRRWMLLFLPAIGGIFSGWIVYTFAPEAEGHGTDAAIDAYHNRGGFIRGRIPIIKTIASALTITSGGSGGREGPIAQIGSGFGSFLATRLKLSDRDRRIMMAAGMGAGVGSIFRAPLAGALFAAEVLYSEPEFESEVIIPAGISSVVAYCTFCLAFGWGSLFESGGFVFQNPLELGPYVILAFVLAGGAILYIRSFYGVRRFFVERVHIPNHLKPALGGLATGVIGFFLPQTLAFGYGFVQMAMENQLSTLFLLGLAFGKILTTSFSIGSGGSGGVFGPSVVIGGALGGVVGRIFHQIMPAVVTQPGAFVVVGMAGFFSAASNTPISTIIFVSEMTNSYHLLLPSLLVCSLSFLFSRGWTIFHNQVPSRIDSNAHKGDFFVDLLGTIRVKELMPQVRKVEMVPETMRFSDFRRVFSATQQHYFPVVDEQKKLTGIFSINDIRSVLFTPEIGDLVLMKDIAGTEIISTTPSEDLNEVLKKFTVRNLQRIPVVREDDPRSLLGMLDRREVIQYYNQRVDAMKAGLGRITIDSDREVSLLKTIRVRDAMKPNALTIPEDMTIEDLRRLFSESKHRSFPVADREGRLVGMVSFSDMEHHPAEEDPARTAWDVATKKVVTIGMDDDLFLALSRISQGDYAILPVIEGPGSPRVVGVISRRDIIAGYEAFVINRKV